MIASFTRVLKFSSKALNTSFWVGQIFNTCDKPWDTDPVDNENWLMGLTQCLINMIFYFSDDNVSSNVYYYFFVWQMINFWNRVSLKNLTRVILWHPCNRFTISAIHDPADTNFHNDWHPRRLLCLSQTRRCLWPGKKSEQNVISKTFG